jgi:hypothetical protein
MPDLLDRVREELSARLAELRPLADEHRRLDLALQALDDARPGGAATAASAPARPARRRGAKAPPTTRARAPQGANRLAVLRAAEDRPGATSAELATVSGVRASTLSPLLARLVKVGELQKETLPTGRTGYRTGAPAAQVPPAPTGSA